MVNEIGSVHQSFTREEGAVLLCITLTLTLILTPNPSFSCYRCYGYNTSTTTLPLPPLLLPPLLLPTVPLPDPPPLAPHTTTQSGNVLGQRDTASSTKRKRGLR